VDLTLTHTKFWGNYWRSCSKIKMLRMNAPKSCSQAGCISTEKINKRVWCNLGVNHKRKTTCHSHALTTPNVTCTRMSTYMWRLVVEEIVSSCKMAYEGETKIRGSVIFKPPVCTSMLWKGGSGFSRHCSCPPPRLLARWRVQCSAAWSYFSSAWSPAVKRNGGILVNV